MGFQADIEAFNGRWQRRVYSRCFGYAIEEVAALSDRYVEGVLARRAVRIEGAPPQRPWPVTPGPRLRRGRIVFVRRTTPHVLTLRACADIGTGPHVLALAQQSQRKAASRRRAAQFRPT
jgi:hypothetical protein